jgi:membrane protease YdiL (CAAX protease family)
VHVGSLPLTAVVAATVLTYTWIVDSRTAAPFVIAPVSVVVVVGLWNAFRTGEWGLDPRALSPSLLVTAVFTACAGAVVLSIGHALGTLHDEAAGLSALGPLILWGGGQQWILQTVVLREAQRRTSPGRAVFLAAALFAMLHFPNPFLALVTFLGAVGWCTIYSRYPNVLPLALSHAVSTIVILRAFDDDVTGRLRVGYAYLMMF